jgi:hypothetical protein
MKEPKSAKRGLPKGLDRVWERFFFFGRGSGREIWLAALRRSAGASTEPTGLIGGKANAGECSRRAMP